MTSPIVVPCADLSEALARYTERLGFRLDAIFPADDPRVALLSGYGLHLRLERARVGSLLVTKRGASPLVEGRATMRYRDLIPGRLGGYLIASEIHIADGGPVPDYVHYHDVHVQLIYCVAGWVRVVYQDQGEPFVLAAGDCVLQPPRIRHRVLECSPGLEVIEISSPAEHTTYVEHALTLPTRTRRPDRAFDGQRFVRHDAHGDALSARDLGIARATGDRARAAVVRAITTVGAEAGEVLFAYVLAGAATLDGERIEKGDALVVPPQTRRALDARSDDFAVLEFRTSAPA